MAVYSFDNSTPVIHETSFVHPLAAVTGNVVIGRNVYIGPGAAIRGDWGKIIIQDGCNVQENCTIHMFPGVTVLLEEGAHVGHGAVIHGAELGKNCLIGMNAVVMDNVQVGKESIVGALTFIKESMKIPERSLVVGNPARIVKPVSDEMIQWKTEGTGWYQRLPEQLHQTLRECEPLRQPIDSDSDETNIRYSTWKETKHRSDKT
ncbi:MAG: transferase hexapeptide repeat family protein [Bacteroidota bacterium]